MSDKMLPRNSFQIHDWQSIGRLAWLLTAAIAAFPPISAAAAPPETVRATVLETKMASQDRDKLVFVGSVEVSGPAGRSYEVYFQMRLNGGELVKLANGKDLFVLSKKVAMPEDMLTARFPDCRVEFPLQDVESAVNLPRGQESLLWVDCSVFDLIAKRYITSDFTVSTPLLITTDQDGKVLKVDADGAWNRMLHSPDPKTRDLMFRAALATAARSKAVFPTVLAALKDQDESLRRGCVLWFQEVAKKYPQNDGAIAAAFKSALTDKDSWVRLYAVEGLWNAEKSEEVIPPAVRLLDGTEVGWRAADLLVTIGRPAVPALRKALLEGDADSSPEAASALLRIGAESKPAVAGLIAAFKKTQPTGDQAVSKTFATNANRFDLIGPNAKEAVPVLVEALAEENEELQGVCVRALGQIGPDAGAAVDSLVVFLKSRNERLRLQAIIALGRIGPRAKGALPLLKDALQEKGVDLRINAAQSMWSIDNSEAALTVLLDSVRDQTDELARRRGLQALRALKIDSQEAYAAVVRAMREDPSHGVRLDAVFALGSYGARAVPDLARAVKDGPKEERNMIILELGDLKGEAKAAVPAITAALKDENEYVRGAAASALKKIDPEAARKAGIE